MNIKIISIDLDGTLVNTLDIHRDAFCQAIKDVHNYIVTPEYHDKYLVGLTTKEKIERLIAYSEISANDNLFKRVIMLKNKYSLDKINLKPNLKLNEILYRLSENIIFTCVTNTSKAFTTKVLMDVHLFELFDYIITGDDVEFHKPKPHPYLLLKDKYPLERIEDFLIVEDSPEGIKSAYTAGFKNIWEVRDPQDLLKIESQI